MAAMSGTWFVFFNRRMDQVKILLFDRHGFWLLLKRLEQGRFTPPAIAELSAADLSLLLDGVDLKVQRFPSVAAKRVA
jgi:transposase